MKQYFIYFTPNMPGTAHDWLQRKGKVESNFFHRATTCVSICLPPAVTFYPLEVQGSCLTPAQQRSLTMEITLKCTVLLFDRQRTMQSIYNQPAHTGKKRDLPSWPRFYQCRYQVLNIMKGTSTVSSHMLLKENKPPSKAMQATFSLQLAKGFWPQNLRVMWEQL